MSKIISQTLDQIEPVSVELKKKAQAHLDSLTKPLGSLGTLEDLSKRYFSIRNNESASIKNISTIVFVADHGVAEEGVSAYPSQVTPQMVFNYLNQGAAVNVLANHIKAEVTIVDIGVNFDFKQREYFTAPFLQKSIERIAEETKSDVKDISSVIITKDDEADKVYILAYKKNDYYKQITFNWLFDNPEEVLQNVV